MEIIVAKHMGFCGGVKRAVEMAQGAAQQADGPVFTWGPLIHNPQVVQRLQAEGVEVTEQLNGLEGEAFVVSALAVRAKELKVLNTLCPAITVRQEEAERLVEEVDALVVVGGHGSSNTTRLTELGRTHAVTTYHIEVPDELDPAWFVGVEKVGVMSGASTPDWIITQVLHRLQEIGDAQAVNAAVS